MSLTITSKGSSVTSRMALQRLKDPFEVLNSASKCIKISGEACSREYGTLTKAELLDLIAPNEI